MSAHNLSKIHAASVAMGEARGAIRASIREKELVLRQQLPPLHTEDGVAALITINHLAYARVHQVLRGIWNVDESELLGPRHASSQLGMCERTVSAETYPGLVVKTDGPAEADTEGVHGYTLQHVLESDAKDFLPPREKILQGIGDLWGVFSGVQLSRHIPRYGDPRGVITPGNETSVQRGLERTAAFLVDGDTVTGLAHAAGVLIVGPVAAERDPVAQLQESRMLREF